MNAQNTRLGILREPSRWLKYRWCDRRASTSLDPFIWTITACSLSYPRVYQAIPWYGELTESEGFMKRADESPLFVHYVHFRYLGGVFFFFLFSFWCIRSILEGVIWY